jgi:RNA polymerase sigma factor (sigma-70 family)
MQGAVSVDAKDVAPARGAGGRRERESGGGNNRKTTDPTRLSVLMPYSQERAASAEPLVDRGGSDLTSGGDFPSIGLLRIAPDRDRGALNQLFARHFPLLRRWAHGRLPRSARNISETADLVQDVMLNAFRRLDAVDVGRRGALQAYLRQSIQNRIRDEFRSFSRRAPHSPLDTEVPDRQPSPLDRAIEAETRERYTRGLTRLRPADQALIVGRLELAYSYEQLAFVTGRRSPEAARIAVRRAMLRLAEEMSRA